MIRQCISVSGLWASGAGTNWRKQQYAVGLTRGEALAEAKADYLIDNGLATGRRLNVMTKGTRNEIIAEIMDWSATWGSPLSREQAEAKADQTIKAARPRWGWPILFMIVAILWVWFIASAIVKF